MKPSIAGIVPMEQMLAGVTSDVIGASDPSGDTIIRLLQAIDRHAEAEADALGQYEHLAEASEDPAIALVVRLILDDEERHHGLLRRIATTLSDVLNWTSSPTALPRAQTAASSRAHELAALTHDLIQDERTGAEALRRLAYREKSLDGELSALLLEMLAVDSDKHVRLLRFVEQRLSARARAQHD